MEELLQSILIEMQKTNETLSEMQAYQQEHDPTETLTEIKEMYANEIQKSEELTVVDQEEIVDPVPTPDPGKIIEDILKGVQTDVDGISGMVGQIADQTVITTESVKMSNSIMFCIMSFVVVIIGIKFAMCAFSRF